MSNQEVVSAEVVHGYLVQFLTPNTRLIAEATAWLRDYLKLPQSVSTMFQILLHADQAQTRQAAGVVLRSRLVKHWTSVDEDVAHVMKDQLLGAFSQEQIPILRKTMADLITLVARLTLPLDHWPEFWPAMFQLANSPEPTHRQSFLGIIEDLGDKIFELMRPQLDDIIAFCQVSLGADQDPHVRVAAMKAAGVLMGEISEEKDPLVAKFRPLVPGMLEIIKFSVQQGADQEAIDGLCIFQAMIETCPNIISPHVSKITEFSLAIASNPEIEWEIRSECLTFMEWVIQFRPSFVIKQHLLDPILDVAFTVAAEPETEKFDAWEVTPHRFSLQVIDCVARFIKPKYTFQNLMSRVDAWMSSQNPFERRAAIGALSAMPNGCVEEMLPAIPQLLPYMVAAFDDPNTFVRQAGCILLGQFADFLSPDILEHYETCLPLAYRAMCEEDPEIQERALYSLITFLENMDNDGIGNMLDQLITRLVNLLQSSNNKDIQDMSISAIAAVASATLDKFVPYWEPIVKLLQELMDVTAPDLIPLRARALDCVGVISMAVTKEVFGPYFHYFMNKALEGFSLVGVESTELRELSINFFANVAEALGQDFMPYFETCLDLILTSLKNIEGSKPELDEQGLQMARLLIDDDEDEEAPNAPVDPDDDEDRLPPELQGLDYVVNQGLVEEKTVSLQALGTFAHALGPLFVPYIDRCLPVLETVSRYVHPKVRSFAIYPLETFLVCIHQSHPSENPWTPGANPEEHPLPENVQSFADSLLQTFLKRIVADFDLGVVSRYLESIRFILNTLGAPAIHNHMPSIGSVILKVLHMETAAQVMETDEGDEDNEEIEQELLAVFNSGCDLIISLAKAYVAQFPIWFPLLEGVIQHLNTGVSGDVEPVEDGSEKWRQEAVGALAEVTEACGVSSYSHEQVHLLLAQAIKALHDPHVSTRCNAIYLARLLVSSPSTFDWWPKILEMIVPLLQSDDEQTIDNCLGCIAIMIQVNPQLLPMSELVPMWLSAFPVRIDQIESGFAFGTLFSLLEHASQDIFPHIPIAFNILIDSLGSPVITDETREKAGEAIKHLWSQYSSELQSVISSLNEEQTNNFNHVIQQ